MYFLPTSAQFPRGNFGDEPGVDLRGATRLTFWAKGERGGERVEFKAGGVRDPAKKYRDSFERSLGVVTLNKEWQQFAIVLAGQDLSSVIGAFALVATKANNPNGLVVYLSEITYQGITAPKPAGPGGGGDGSTGGSSASAWGPPADQTLFADNLAALRDAFASRCFVAYAPSGVDPWRGIYPDDDSIGADLDALAALGIDGVVTYGVTGTQERIASFAHARGFAVVQGVWNPLDQDEIARALAACSKGRCLALVVGNEGLMRGDYTTQQLVRSMATIRYSTNLPVTSSEPLDSAYSAELRELGDWVFPNAHPIAYGQREPEAAAAWTLAAYRAAQRDAGSKLVVFKEVGLPSRGEPGDDSFGEARQAEYYRRIARLPVRYVVFEAIDSPAKAREAGLNSEGAWGVLRADRTPKPAGVGPLCPSRSSPG